MSSIGMFRGIFAVLLERRASYRQNTTSSLSRQSRSLQSTVEQLTAKNTEDFSADYAEALWRVGDCVLCGECSATSARKTQMFSLKSLTLYL